MPTAGRPHIVVEFDTSLPRETTCGFCALEVTPEQPHGAGPHLSWFRMRAGSSLGKVRRKLDP
jgi:hypothetical protein